MRQSWYRRAEFATATKHVLPAVLCFFATSCQTRGTAMYARALDRLAGQPSKRALGIGKSLVPRLDESSHPPPGYRQPASPYQHLARITAPRETGHCGVHLEASKHVPGNHGSLQGGVIRGIDALVLTVATLCVLLGLAGDSHRLHPRLEQGVAAVYWICARRPAASQERKTGTFPWTGRRSTGQGRWSTQRCKSRIARPNSSRRL